MKNVRHFVKTLQAVLDETNYFTEMKEKSKDLMKKKEKSKSIENDYVMFLN